MSGRDPLRRLLAMLLFLAVMSALTYCRSQAPAGSEAEAGLRRAVPDLNADARVDVAAMDKYEAAVLNMLDEHKFAQLDELAASLRAGKTRFGGGPWKLYIFYRGLKQPTGGYKAPDAAWDSHIANLLAWARQNPQSVTAWIALSEAYFEYSQKARLEGDEAAAGGNPKERDWQTVTDRRHGAKLALKEAEQLNTKCPHYYFVKQKIAGKPDTKLLQEARAFEPGYYYYYRMQGLLLHLYSDEAGAAEKFADKTAADIGGDEGKIVYYEIAAAINGNGGGLHWPPAKFPWERILAGYAALEKQYGASLFKENQMAYMAIQFLDTLAAKPFFAQIGDQWDQETWGTKAYFESSRDWSMSPPEFAAVLEIANNNYKTQPGEQYYQDSVQEYRANFRPVWKSCSERLQGDFGGSFDLLMQVAGDGTIQKAKVWPLTKLGTCLAAGVVNRKLGEPPSAPYWLRFPTPMQPITPTSGQHQ